MTLDVRGSLKNTKLSTNSLAVVEELFSNAVDAFLIRKRGDPAVAKLEVTFDVEFVPTDLLGADIDLILTCQDNGVGLGDEQTKAFLTKDTSYKDDLGIAGIGQCKGAGRIQFFHHFTKLELVSIYSVGDKLQKRTLTFEESQKQIEPESFRISPIKTGPIGTRIVLSGLKASIRPKVFVGLDIEAEFSAKSLKNHILVFFMHRLIGLKQHLGEFVVSFASRKRGQTAKPVKLSLTPADLPKLTTAKESKVFERDRETGKTTTTSHALTVSHYALDAKKYDLPSNIIALCAKSSPVKIVTDHFLKPKAVENNPINEAYHVVLVEGDFLDQKVNEQRDGFDIPQSFQRPELFLNERVALDDILDAISETVEALIRPPEWSRDEVAKDVKETFGVSQQMLADTDTRIVFGDTPHAVAKRVLTKYQERAIEETSKLFDLKEEIYKAEPDSEAFREKVNELAWKHTAMLKTIDMANLSQLIVRRAAIVEILALACGRNLRIQNDTTKRRKDEELIHNIFFPRRKDSRQVTDHDVWLLSEEYHYFEYIASDVPLASIRFSDDSQLFDADIDQEFQKILSARTKENAGKRPDIALFSSEGASIIVEFKSPGVSMDDHVGDLMEYSQLLAAKSKGRLKRFYGYLIGDTVNPLRLSGYTQFPSGKGFFNSVAIVEPVTQRPLGGLYSEILFYDDVVDRAGKRIDIYKKRLNVNLT